jgi:hypothetical protein
VNNLCETNKRKKTKRNKIGVAIKIVVAMTKTVIKSPSTVIDGVTTPDISLELPTMIAHWTSPKLILLISENGALKIAVNKLVEKLVSCFASQYKTL